ncbi:zinc finger, CCHC-type containing protein [Tanacetum coccineum]
MTTSVGNNSVFRSFFEKQKLTEPNFIDWYRQLRLILSTEDKENYLEHPIPVAPVAQPGQQVPPEALAAHAAWELLQTVREFHTCKQEEVQSVSSYVLKMKGYIDNLERLGQPVGQNLAVSLILVSLNKDFASFVQNFNMHGMGKTVNELHAMLKLHEETLPKRDANPALHAIRARRVQKKQKNKPHKAGKGGQGKGKNKMGYAHNNVPFAPKPKTPPPPKKDNPAKDAICHQCGEVGHWRRNCPVYLTELMKKKKLSQGASASGIFTIELYSFPSKSWIYDTGCGTHICITTQGLRGSRKLKPGALSLYVGDGHRAAVEAIGTYHLELPSGLVIVLNNCHYAPSITRGVISVSRLFDDGFINRFDDNNVINDECYYHHEEDDQEIDEPQSDINPIRRSTRTRRPTDRLCLYIDTEEHELGDLGEPANYRAALLDPESKKWLDAMNVEMQSMKDNDVWVLVELPPNARTVGSKWLFKKKTDMDETFSPVADIRAIRILIAIAAYYDYEIWQMDVKTDFLNGHLSEEVYMEQPEGFVNQKYPNHNPGEEHWTAVKNILKYLRNTKDMFLVLIGWKSTKQSIFATSSTDAEYIAAFDASKEAVWIRKFISGLGIVPTIEEPISMYCDNTRAIAIAKDDGVTKGIHIPVNGICNKGNYKQEIFILVMSPPARASRAKFHWGIAFATGRKRFTDLETKPRMKHTNRRVRIPKGLYPRRIEEKLTKNQLIEDEDEPLEHEASDKEVDSDLKSTASSKPKWKKIAKADPDRASRNCPYCSK